MKYACMVLVTGLLVAAQPPKADTKKDEDKLQGVWVVDSMTAGGQVNPEAKGDKITFKGDKFTVVGKMGEMKGSVKLDTTKKPKQVDLDFTEGPFTGKSLGIYSLEGNELKMSMGMPGGDERPKELTSKEGTMHLLIVFKRETK